MTTNLVSQSRRPELLPPPPNESRDFSEIRHLVENLQIPPSPGAIIVSKQDDLEHQLFDALAQAKILTSQVAMHLDTVWRHKLFQQLDSLHDIAEWEAGDEPLQRESFATFLKAILNINPKRRPGLGLSHAGHLVAAWMTNSDRLTIEFLAHDRVRWVLSRGRGDVPERFAGETRVDLLPESLAQYNPDHWFSNAQKE